MVGMVPEQQCDVESSYCYGDQLPIPPSSTVLYSHLRIELMEAMPKPIQVQCRNYGTFDSIGILVRVMRLVRVMQAMPAKDLFKIDLV
eukprot:5758646-Prorocentrum_lima.AAC.1